MELDLSIRGYLRAFSADWLARMSGPISVPFAAIALWVSGSARILWGCLAAVCFFTASYRLWRNQQTEIARLSARPYSEEQKRLVKERIAPLGADGGDVLRYMVQFGEREQQKIFADAGINENEFGQIFTRVAQSGLLNSQERQKAGRTGLDLFWRINQQFAEVLKDELFPRQEESVQRCFLIQ